MIGICSVVELIVISFNLFSLKWATVTYDQFNQINKNDAPSRAQRCLDVNDILFQTVRVKPRLLYKFKCSCYRL